MSGTSETAASARPDSVPERPDAVDVEPESDLRWALGHPAEALERLRPGVWVGAGLLALAGVRLASGDVGWWMLPWGCCGALILVRACGNGGPFGRGADEPDEEEQWIETDQPVIGLPVRILAGVFGTLMLLFALAVLLSASQAGAEILLATLVMGLAGGAMLYAAVRGGGNVRVLAPPVPHPAYLLGGASSSDPAAHAPALPGGDALPDLPIRSPAEPAPAHRPAVG